MAQAAALADDVAVTVARARPERKNRSSRHARSVSCDECPSAVDRSLA